MHLNFPLHFPDNMCINHIFSGSDTVNADSELVILVRSCRSDFSNFRYLLGQIADLKLAPFFSDFASRLQAVCRLWLDCS